MRKLTKKTLSIVLCLMLIVSAFSSAISITAETGDTTTLPDDVDYASTVVGTGKDGKTGTVTGFGASDVNVGLANADFSEGFNDWTIFRRWDTVADTASLSGIASVENGLVTIKGRSYHDDGTTVFDSEGLGLVSQPFTIPGLASGDKLILTIAAGRGTKIRGAIGEYNTTDNGGVYSLTNEAENNLGKSTPNYPYDLWVTSELTVTDPSAYFVVTIRNKDITKDVSFKDVRIYKVTSDKNLIDVTNGCTQDSATVNANGGTAEDGMLVARDVNNTYYATDLVTTSLMNGNFKDGLKYWRMAFLNVTSGANAGRRGFPSYYTEIVDGAAVIKGYYDQNQGSQSGIRTPDINLDAHVGKNLSFSLNVVKVASGGGVRVRILKNGTQIYRSSTVYSAGIFTTDEVTIEEGARYALEIGCNNDASKNGKTYITIDDVTLNVPGLEPDVPAGPPAYYGSEENGFNSTYSSWPMNLKPVDSIVNLDFSDGFIYWSGKDASTGGGTLASASLKIATEGDNKYVTVKDEGYVANIQSALFKASNVAVGDKLAIIYDAKGADAKKLRVTLKQDYLRGADQEVSYDSKTGLNTTGKNPSPGGATTLVGSDSNLSAITVEGTPSGWTTYLAANSKALIDPVGVSSSRPCLADIFLQVAITKASDVAAGDMLDVGIDNIRIVKIVDGVYTDIVTNEVVYDINNLPEGTIPSYYGSEEDGFNSKGTSSYPQSLKPADTLVNLDFSDGFIYWSGKNAGDPPYEGSYASDSFKLVTEGDNKYITTRDDGYVSTMRSILMKAENVAVGDQLAVLYDAKGADAKKLRVTLVQDHLRGADQGVVYDPVTGMNTGANASAGSSNILVNSQAPRSALDELPAPDGWTAYVTDVSAPVNDPADIQTTRPCTSDIYLQVVIDKAPSVNPGDKLDAAIDNIRIVKIVDELYYDISTNQPICRVVEHEQPEVNATHLIALVNAVLEGSVDTELDYNGDGMVDLLDVVFLKKWLADIL